MMKLDMSALAASAEHAAAALAKLGVALARHPQTPSPELVLRLARLSKGLPAVPPRLNGVRLRFDPRGSWGWRWHAYEAEPVRVRTCRGRRR
jgi:hypothetical protein